jgi:hypothetical protein
LTLWAAAIAERVGFDEEEASTIGKTVAGLTAQAKGRRLGIYHALPPEEVRRVHGLREDMTEKEIPFMDRTIPCIMTHDGIRPLTRRHQAVRRTSSVIALLQRGMNTADTLDEDIDLHA